MVKLMEPDQILTRREAAAILECSTRTISRRIKEGQLETVYRSSGVPGVTLSSVMTLKGVDTPPIAVAQSGDRDVATTDVALVATYAALWQASRAVTEAGLLGRRAAMQQLRQALDTMPNPQTGLATQEATTIEAKAVNHPALPATTSPETSDNA